MEVVDGIATADLDPAAIHLKGDEGRVGETDEFLKGDDAVLRGELHGVVVVAELHSGFGDFLPEDVELVSVETVVVKRERANLVGEGVVFETGGIANAGEGTDDVLGADGVVEIDRLVEGFGEVVVGVVRADAGETGAGHGGFDLLWRLVVEASSFHLSVADGGDLAEGACVVLSEHRADGVELQSDGKAPG